MEWPGMKKAFYLFILFLLTGVEVFGQIRDRSHGNGTFDAYLVRPQEYVILRDPFLVDGRSGRVVKKENLSPGVIIRPSLFGRIWVDFLEYNRGELNVIDYKEGDETTYISIDDIAVARSAVFPESLVTKQNTAPAYHWLPAYTLDIVQSGERDAIFAYEAGRWRKYPVENAVYWWYERQPFPSEVWITNTFINIRQYTNASFYSLIQEIVADDYRYHITLSISSWKETFKEDAAESLYSWNFPEIGPSRHGALLLEHNAARNRMRIYNGETRRIIFDLVKVSHDFYEKYIEFIQSNVVPDDLVIPPDLLAGWPGDIKIASPYSYEKSEYKVSSNLRLRSLPSTDSEILATISQGEAVAALEPGLSGTIEGITAPWVWVETGDGAQGWCFSGYLEAVAPAAQAPGPVSAAVPADPEETVTPAPPPATPSTSSSGGGLPIEIIAGGIAACLVLAVVVLCRRVV
jgi:hypothetical protein